MLRLISLSLKKQAKCVMRYVLKTQSFRYQQQAPCSVGCSFKGALILKEIWHSWILHVLLAVSCHRKYYFLKVGKKRNQNHCNSFSLSTNQAPETSKLWKHNLIGTIVKNTGSVGRLPRNESVLETAWLCGLCDLQQVNSSFFVRLHICKMGW